MSGKKVLIITGNPARTDTNTGKTICALFDGFPRDELAQLYFSPERPAAGLCGTYYQICEKQIIKSAMGLIPGRCGGETNVADALELQRRPETNALALTKRKNQTYMRVLRECVWKFSFWRGRALSQWLDKVRPEVIFAFLLDTIAASDTVRRIAERRGIPVVLFITDDYYNDTELGGGPVRRLFYERKKASVRAMSGCAVEVAGCSDSAAREFGELFGLPYEAIYTPAKKELLAMPAREQRGGERLTLRYFGNLGLGRKDTIIQIGNALREINSGAVKAVLEVYSGLTDPEIISQLNIENGCEFKGWVGGEDYIRALGSADIVLHVESFAEDMIRRTRLSVSTKIADYLGAGKCVMAVGPAELASMEHLRGAACVVNRTEDIRAALEELISAPEMRAGYQLTARALALKSHDEAEIRRQMADIIERAGCK